MDAQACIIYWFQIIRCWIGFDSLRCFVTPFSLQVLQEFASSNTAFLKNEMHHILDIVTVFPGRQGQRGYGTWHATWKRFLHFGSKMNPQIWVGANESGLRVEGIEPVLCDYILSIICHTFNHFMHYFNVKLIYREAVLQCWKYELSQDHYLGGPLR